MARRARRRVLPTDRSGTRPAQLVGVRVRRRRHGLDNGGAGTKRQYGMFILAEHLDATVDDPGSSMVEGRDSTGATSWIEARGGGLKPATFGS